MTTKNNDTCECGTTATKMIEHRKYNSETVYTLDTNHEWEYVDEGTDDGDDVGTDYFCNVCFPY